MATYEIEKFIYNGDEFTLPSSGSGGLDETITKALIDMGAQNYNGVFRGTVSGLYRILNEIDNDDSCGLSEGDTWDDIIANQTSMNLISHSWGVMSAIARSSYAVSQSIADSTARTEYVNSWIAMMTIASSKIAMTEVVKNADMISAMAGSSVAIEAIGSSPVAIELLLKSTLVTSSQYTAFFGDTGFAKTVYYDNNLLTLASKNQTDLPGLKASSYWSSILGNQTKIDIMMENAGSWVIANETSANLRADVPLRSIIQHDLLDSYIAKDERAYNGIITIDVDSTSATTFSLSRYGYNAATSTWKISVDGGTWSSVSIAASTTAYSINLGSTGKHTIVIKPNSYAVGWARQMGNRNSTNYWGLTGYTWSIRNLPVYAFTSSSTSATNYCLYYAFYGVTNLTSVNIKMPSTMTAVGNYFMGYAFRGCTALTSLGTGFNLGTVTSSVGTYLLYYAWYGCTALTGLPFGFKLPTVGNSSNYMRYTWSNCTNLTSDSPAENLTFIYAATNCFSSSGISTASPTAGSSIAVHRI